MTDLDIARAYEPATIDKIASKLDIKEEDLEFYGKYKAKLPLHIAKEAKQGKLILVSAISPTPAGEGKTTMSIGLHDALCKLKKRSLAVLREPSLGPVFGIKGGATGGGHAQVVPMEDINLHFTGDFSAIESAHNLLSALIDNHLHFNQSPQIDPRSVLWKRAMDLNDRALRHINVGLGGRSHGMPRETGFDITAASEIMAILCMALDLNDLKKRLGNILVAYTFDRKPVFARDLKAEGAMAALLKDAIKPNLVQSLEGNPVLMHGGPFANIAQGTNTIIATQTGLRLADYVVTEAGFGFDLGGEKFLDLKCRAAALAPEVVVLVATVRALKYHGEQPLAELQTENVDALRKGMCNLEKHLENVKQFGLPAVVVVNRFPTDTEAEIAAVIEECEKLGVRAVTSTAWANGGEGSVDLAKAVLETIDEAENDFSFLYNLDLPVEKKIEKIATQFYGAAKVSFTSTARRDLKRIQELGMDDAPICIAKTQKSLSDDPTLKGRPKDFNFQVRGIEIAAGAGFVIPLSGEIMRMPGLPKAPAAQNIDIDKDGNISGLF
ncbi:formate--tetrahydrofolate ligase [Croceimicrobium hydrocarbonivorans]|uniref:Formate--tetrahydrofolate ligase n=1 Tax=Croceimicrobium hydrocarbonivorans TaxID=2761580 RepID=A0A7H0VFE7_9FLAO|nr:formate--tetrahydrofolate ligase [Croceimicrobium hydrocarbonivorans]QNR24445.1 formate--tetrahydrofolate ligase [Croceimicrobium hydrocarbonivorans]